MVFFSNSIIKSCATLRPTKSDHSSIIVFLFHVSNHARSRLIENGFVYICDVISIYNVYNYVLLVVLGFSSFFLFSFEKKGLFGRPGEMLYFPPLGWTPPPCSKTKHRPWDGHHVWIHDVYTSVVMGVRGINNWYEHCYKLLSYSSPCIINGKHLL